MDPSFWSALVLVGGAVFLALGALYAVKTAAKWPEIIGRLTTVEVIASEAYEMSKKAQRIASSRASRARKKGAPVDVEPDDVPANPRGRVFTPGRGQDGRIPSIVRPGNRGATGTDGPVPVGFVDE